MEQDSLSGMRKIKTVLLNETGQMSIFVALIFQVLFVFFAMVINVGLLVHDKINLQNAVDLGAYYAAQKQAEILNEIAHTNYQIRQDYKLLTWRYRVLGTLGRQGSNSPTDQTFPPARRDPGGLTDKAFQNPAYDDKEFPSVCVSNDMWWDFTEKSKSDENYCFSKYGVAVPKIPDVVQIAGGIVPQVGESAGYTKMAQQAQQIACKQAGPLNWAFTMQMFYAYKLSVATRKEIIWELRKNLIAGDPKDRQAQSLKAGIAQTVSKNLTAGNRAGFDQTNLEVINGLADPSCNKGDDGEFILPEVRIVPAILFTMLYDCDQGDNSRMQDFHDTSDLDTGELDKWDPGGLMRNLAKGEPEPTNAVHSSLGFEKNPWCMAYMGVKAKTSTSKPFSPFGQPIQLEARAFAAPFGGRIGPWYKAHWTRGAPMSAEGDRVDPLTAPRLLAGGAMDGNDNLARLPNYSRYPGDKLGMKSEISLGAQGTIIKSYRSGDKEGRLRLAWFTGFDSIPEVGDPLSIKKGDANFALRKAEISAITPDLFDATYYSIDPNYADNYTFSDPAQRFGSAAPIFGHRIKQLPDIGGRNDDDALARFNVGNQIENSVGGGGLDGNVLPKLYYVIRQWEHLLTGWVQRSLQNFEFPQDRFGQCQKAASDKMMIPGRCWQGGGRTGYSVRLISKSHLAGTGWKVGGDGEAEGAILNPPPQDF